MRWSLFLSAFITIQATLSFVCVALPISSESSWDELERREPPASNSVKASSKVYRQNALRHPHAYFVKKDGTIQQHRHIKVPRRAIPAKWDADHAFETQIYNKVLKDKGLNHKNLPPELREQAKRIMNDPRNMVLIPAGINRGKGSMIKHALRGKAITPKAARNQYTLLTYPTQKKTARKLDKAFKFDPKRGFTAAVRKTLRDAKILKLNQPSPATSRSTSRSSSRSRSSSPPPKKRGTQPMTRGRTMAQQRSPSRSRSPPPKKRSGTPPMTRGRTMTQQRSSRSPSPSRSGAQKRPASRRSPPVTRSHSRVQRKK
jgi:hypothetical protein